MPEKTATEDRIVLDTSTPPQIRQFDVDELNSLYEWYPGAMIHKPVNGFKAIGFSLSLMTFQELLFHDVYFASDFYTEIREDSHVVQIFVPVQGQFEVDIYGDVVLSTADIGVIDSGNGVKSYWRASDRYHRVFAIPRDSLIRTVVAHTGKPVGDDIRFEPAFRMDENPGAMIRALAETFHQGTVLSDVITRSPLLAANLREALLEIALVNLPHSLSDLYQGRAPRAASWQVKRAREYIERHASEALSVEGIAQACHLSVRTLYATFRDQLGTTPKLYLRAVRLAGVRRELIDLASQATVADIARRWGFLNLSLFARQYREAYGELPFRSRKARRVKR